MPEYFSPGVYVEEVERGARPIEGVSTSVAGFVGETERGPTEPQYITSFAQFRRTFGGFVEDRYLAYAVDGFFRNGGSRCYVARVVPSPGNQSWVTAPTEEPMDNDALGKATLTDDEEDGNDVLNVFAVGPGVWGGNVAVKVGPASLPGDDLFKLTVGYWSDGTGEDDPDYDDIEGDPFPEEIYDNLSLDPGSSDYYEKRITGFSSLIEATSAVGDGEEDPGLPAVDTTTHLEVDVTPDDETYFRRDYEGNDTPGARTGLEAFKEVDEISIVCVPDENAYDGLTSNVVEHCDPDSNGLGDRIAVLQASQTADPDDLPDVTSDYAAIYYPWIKVRDPETNVLKLVPPGGHVAGIYARSDRERGVHKAPANEVVQGVEELQLPITKAEQARLNPKGVNCIRSFRGRGIRVWGARTTSSNTLWKYVNVRRLFLYIEESIDEGTQWVVFEPNNEQLWARVRQTITNFLTNVWRDGALMGTTPEEAFFVKCDRSTMTQDDIDNGRLICEIGVAPVKPAEFVIFRIAQWTGGAE